jgi:hypothetical protein
LNLIEEKGEVTVTINIMASELSDNLLMSGAETQFTILAISEGKEALAEGEVATGIFPYLEGLEHWHQQFLPSYSVQLLTYYLLYLAQHPPPQGQVRINPRR